MVATPNRPFGRVNVYTDNPSATVAPGVNNDVTEGYSPGSRWYDSTGQVLYMCLDNTNGAAVWKGIAGLGLPGTGTVAGGATTVAGGAAVSATGGALILSGGNVSGGNNNGGAVTIKGGTKAGSGTNGQIILVGFPATNPSVAGALYGPTAAAGALSISAG